MNIISTLKSNWRDIVAGIVITIVAAIAADIVTNMSIKQNGLIWLANVATVLQGAARFFAANMIAFLCFAIAWPTVNSFSNNNFVTVWKTNFSDKERLLVVIAIACVYVVSASIALGA